MPFFHINDIFGYWPLNDTIARLWIAYDNNINVNIFIQNFLNIYL